MNMVDASGWVEYFLDSPRADLFASAIEDTPRLLVTSINLYEVHRVLSRKLPAHLRDTCLDLMRRAPVIDFTDARAVAAADVALMNVMIPPVSWGQPLGGCPRPTPDRTLLGRAIQRGRLGTVRAGERHARHFVARVASWAHS